MKTLAPVATLALIATQLLAAAALAQPTVTVELGTGFGGTPNVLARVTDEQGSPVTRRTVEFYLMPDFFPNDGGRLHGSRPVYLGVGTTDTTGTARSGFTPPFTGTALFEARLLAGDGRTETSAQLETDIVRSLDPSPPSISKPLASIRLPLGFAILGLVAGLWLFLIIVTVTTVRTLRKLGKEEPARTA